MLITDILTTFRQGKALANPALWANTASATSVLSGCLIGGFHVAKGLGYDFGESDAQLAQIAAGVVALVSVATGVVHVLANKDAGLPSPGAPAAAAKPDPTRDAGPGPG